MNAAETLTLCRYVKACCPAQAMDEYTPDAWADLLADLRYTDAHQAARNLAQQQPFIAPADIRREVRRIRDRRLAEHPPPEPPDNLDPAAYQAWLQATRRAIADGSPAPAPAELPERDTTDLARIDKRPA